MGTKMMLLCVVAGLFCGLASAIPHPVTQNPALRGVSYIEPAPEYECTENGAFPHETDCQYYYDCYNDEASLMLCTNMTLFDTKWGSCDNPRIVDCGDRIRPTNFPGTGTPPATVVTRDPSAPTTPAPPTRPPGNYTCPIPGGAFEHPQYCEYFYRCVDNEATLEKCQLNYLFDLTFSGCNFAHLTHCQDRERPEGYPAPSTTTAKPPVTDEDGNTVTTTKGTTLPPATPPPGNFTCPSPGGAFPHEKYCEYFWRCVDNEASLEICQLDYLFDLTFSGCNFPHQTHCQDRERPIGYPSPSTTTTTGRPPVTDENGSTVTTTKGTTALPATPPPGDFTCPEPGGAFPHEKYCEYFWRCVDNEATLEICQLDYLFDLTFSGCNFPHQTHCQDRERPIGYPSPSTTTARPPVTDGDGNTVIVTTTTRKPGPEFECPEPDGLFPDPNDCKSFYQCSNDSSFHMTCPGELYFSIPISICDHKSEVDCGDRPVLA